MVNRETCNVELGGAWCFLVTIGKQTSLVCVKKFIITNSRELTTSSPSQDTFLAREILARMLSASSQSQAPFDERHS